MSNLLGNRRIGRFSIHRELLIDEPEVVALILKQCWFIIKADYAIEFDGFRYTAICEEFAELPEGNIPPEYIWEVSATPEGLDIHPR